MSPSTQGTTRNRLLARAVIVVLMVTLSVTGVFATNGDIPQADPAATEQTQTQDTQTPAEPVEPAAPAQEQAATATEEPKGDTWLTEQGKTYCLNEAGDYYKNGFFTIADEAGEQNKYYFDKDGVMQTGIIKLAADAIYIANDEGVLYTDGLFTYNGKSYFADADGKLALNKMVTVGKTKYLMAADGAARTGYIKVSDTVRYIANDKGAIRTGWIKYGNKEYYGSPSGALYRNGLARVGRYVFGFDANGAALVNTSTVIKGYTYKFDKYGALYKSQPTGTTVAKFAVRYKGRPYRYGGTSLTKGADCSGFTMAVYRSYGIKIPRTARGQMKVGKKVKTPQPGDLVIYRNGGHAAIYIGNGKVIHAMTRKKGIRITSVYLCGKPTCYRRVLN